MSVLCFKSGYKYQLHSPFKLTINIKPEKDIITHYIQLNTQGELLLNKGYAWDGASGPAPDFDNAMTGALVHDALYQLIRHGELSKSYKDEADYIFYELCIRSGLNRPTAWIYYKAVQKFGDPHIKKSAIRPTNHLPKHLPCICKS